MLLVDWNARDENFTVYLSSDTSQYLGDDFFNYLDIMNSNPPTCFSQPIQKIYFTFRHFVNVYFWANSIFFGASIQIITDPKTKMAFSVFIFIHMTH